MKINQVAAQLYTLRDYLKTSADIVTSLKKVRAIGYEAVQLSGLGPISEEDLVKILQDTGLVCCATHEPSDDILNTPEKVVERLQKLGCKYTAYPYPSGVDMTDFAQVKGLAAKLDKSGAVLSAAGQVLTYHNHHHEFFRHEGKQVLRHIYDLADANNLQAEIDTYWVQFGGCDPAEWCASLKGRLPLLHMKDYAITKKIEPFFAEIGNGNLDWKKIIPAAEQSGCEWFIIEQDTCPGDPFDSLRMSFDYVRANLVS